MPCSFKKGTTCQFWNNVKIKTTGEVFTSARCRCRGRNSWQHEGKNSFRPFLYREFNFLVWFPASQSFYCPDRILDREDDWRRFVFQWETGKRRSHKICGKQNREASQQQGTSMHGKTVKYHGKYQSALSRMHRGMLWLTQWKQLLIRESALYTRSEKCCEYGAELFLAFLRLHLLILPKMCQMARMSWQSLFSSLQARMTLELGKHDPDHWDQNGKTTLVKVVPVCTKVHVYIATKREKCLQQQKQNKNQP